ncbi:MAG TPA: hypothetical protein VN802_21655 [Stellaceae bacterium]|nr:hypothetical protein [Stellaceae bacterium]
MSTPRTQSARKRTGTPRRAPHRPKSIAAAPAQTAAPVYGNLGEGLEAAQAALALCRKADAPWRQGQDETKSIITAKGRPRGEGITNAAR